MVPAVSSSRRDAIGHLPIDWARRSWVVALLVGLLFGSFFVLRYLGLWSDSDTATFVGHIEEVITSGRLDSPGSYPHGYGYPVWVATLVSMTGASVSSLQREYLPIVGNALLALFGFVAFNALLKSPRLAALSAMVLFLVPEVYFTVSRGNHEKLTVSMTLLALLTLAGSFNEFYGRRRWAVFSGWVLVFYLAAVTLGGLNVLFGSSFIVGITITVLAASLVIGLRRRETSDLVPITRRMVLVSSTSWLFVALVMFFIYPKAGNNLLLLDTTIERVGALALTMTAESDPYAAVQFGWSSPLVYQFLSSFRWILFFTSFTAWIVLMSQSWRHLRHLRVERVLLMSLYGAFGLQLAVAIPVDFLGLGAGTNLQVRMYTYFALFSAPVFALGLSTALERWVNARTRLVRYGVLTLTALFVVFSVAKATLDPVVSNRWLYFWESEIRALGYLDGHLERAVIWTGVDARLSNALRTERFREWAATRNSLSFDLDSSPRTTHAVWSPVIELAAKTRGVPTPVLWRENLTYDNGEARIYHRIPRTPFQR